MSALAAVGFLVAVLPLVLTPGASFTLTTQHTLTGQPRAAGWVIGGTATGIYLHAVLAAAGLSAIVMSSAVAFTVVKMVGGCYLIALGAWMIWTTRGPRRPAPEPSHNPAPAEKRGLYVQAFLANVLNPKAAAVYLTLAPQFLTAAQVSIWPMLIMASIHVAMMSLWLGIWAGALARSKRLVKSPRFGTYINRIGGAVLIVLGSSNGRGVGLGVRDTPCVVDR